MIFLLSLCLLWCNSYYAFDQKLKVPSKEVSLTYDDQGYPKKDSIKALIASQYLQLNNKKIIIKEISGGYYTKKMYVVFIKENKEKIPLFFLKISKKYDSAKKLKKLQEGIVGEKLFKKSSRSSLPPHINKTLPTIVLLDTIFTYTNQHGEKEIIEVSPSAKGELIQDILNSHDATVIKKTALALGKSLAAFQQIFIDYKNTDDAESWRTMIHADFSAKNTMYDLDNNQIYFIDNETMKEASVAQDIKTMLLSLVMLRYIKKNYAQRWPLYLDYALAFLKGYMETYPPEKRKSLALYVKKYLENALDKAFHQGQLKDKTITSKDFNEKEFKNKILKYLQSF